ncbi:hypothetical protein ebA3783 [Aromatoleum aromaticum EbN1]|uniref:Uncharacterized protein n=1 Tax=Aromatoleum aromaticum (strain DSM 19018 / LMG 30748 / EbN1) TaxID=76114 RepID=Q5P358_AROAE|nr:hypothetical protein ebA3783 [Aromatoleum aromaticum EbN1]
MGGHMLRRYCPRPSGCARSRRTCSSTRDCADTVGGTILYLGIIHLQCQLALPLRQQAAPDTSEVQQLRQCTTLRAPVTQHLFREQRVMPLSPVPTRRRQTVDALAPGRRRLQLALYVRRAHLPLVTDRHKGAGHDRRNGATWRGLKVAFRTVRRMG